MTSGSALIAALEACVLLGPVVHRPLVLPRNGVDLSALAVTSAVTAIRCLSGSVGAAGFAHPLD
ncbi:hypothetical protein DLE60_08840 [Micromonospora globispora]|uniref:Uncharacterized protein n=1 Tax=Micromonospora globispora TaxID=1450148 RepID=A0A317JZ55_9ACTN|nr:hypothetical protein DLJ46_19255 [Micromonospora globispora]PWU60842.1 hypothetical protein DLE60_08840 [Micromonospora globispora]RQW95700.1 hypothetical protein DKL51_14470 [Micromonospora globispora]